MKKIALLGATGSIGLQTLDLVRSAPHRYEIESLAAAGSDLNLLVNLIEEFKPKLVSVKNKEIADELNSALAFKTKIAFGSEGLIEVALSPDAKDVVIALVGALGIEPTLKALDQSKNLIVANKETLVAAGDLIRKSIQENGGSLIPADSEHVAIHQCLGSRNVDNVQKIYITASGGPFYFSKASFEEVSVEDALNHPTWKMGPKITIDSATLMNKGLEVIEAQRLFNFSYDQIDVLVHPQSLIHSLVEFKDGNILAQLGPNDMRLAIQYALDYPERNKNLSKQRLNLKEIKKLEFLEIDYDRFPCLNLAYEAGRLGKTYPAVLCAADEIAVELFLNKRIRFSHIPQIIERTLESHSPEEINNYDDVKRADLWARGKAKEISNQLIDHITISV
ncbi:MAG: 1-deoxy-D-xylulose-5-phosphate reductoisomerase [Candidatus Caenarcaniphilales bacterium]|nr:1-deoxy-D-xylulose-5-phosphate reductoisomerase [Candidatus Caenarcaniphilales bacterium]